MLEPKDLNLKDFQSKVFEEYNALKGLSEIDPERFKNPYQNFPHPSAKQNPVTKLIWTGFFNVLSYLEKKAQKTYFTRQEYVINEKMSEEIISHLKIRDILCGSLSKEITNELIESEKDIKIIKIVTSALTDKSIAKEFSINIDANLFAQIAYKISQMGVENYCSKRKN